MVILKVTLSFMTVDFALFVIVLSNLQVELSFSRVDLCIIRIDLGLLIVGLGSRKLNWAP